MLLFERRTTENAVPFERPAGVSEALAALLYARGAHDAAAMEAFLNPCDATLLDPYMLNDMGAAVSRIRFAVEKGERICVYGDYDADGVCATSILYLCLKKLGADVCYHIPNRHSEGYGMNVTAVKKLADDKVKLIVTVDNGVKSVEETALASSLGMEVIVTDHHRCGDTLPSCTALVCTAIPESLCMDFELCGAGIALKLAQALTGGEPDEDSLVLAGLASVADVVPLLGENRSLVARALRIVNGGGGPVGLKALLAAANAKRVDARAFAFLLAPRLNAAGRLEDASLSVELLTCEDEARAREIAQKLDELNAKRKKEEQSILELAYESVEQLNLTNRRGIVLKGETWNSGVVGIAAARISEKYHRPTVLFSERDGLLTGSARSIPGVDLHLALKRCESLFVRFGGHAYAAGVTMEAKNLAAFEEAFEEALRETADDSLFLPRKSYELELPFSKVNLKLAQEIEKLEPFGEGNPEPLLRADNVHLKNLKRIGGEGAHLSLTAELGGAYANAVGFFMGDKFALALDADRADILFTPKSDAFFGEPALKLHLTELRPSRIENADVYIEARNEKFMDAISRNVRYNKNCGFRATAVSDAFETAANEAGKSFAGVAALCFTPKGAARFLRFLSERDLSDKFDVRFFSPERSACAYHTLLFAPDLTASDLSRFQSVVVCDSPLFKGMLARLNELAPNANIYVAPPVNGDAEPILTSVRFDRDFMAKTFRAFKAADRAFYNRPAALDALSKATGAKRCMCSLALDVMLELGFVTENKKGNIELVHDPKSRELTQSGTFRAAEALLKDHEAYKEELDHGA
ncbi:MAG TPA: single-stranded-DNA-specific exonuclease RecJ [Clostridia bacterium]|nr:single-stranded-DNA-specific exonuclease RecJ [Clostridia bacterium]